MKFSRGLLAVGLMLWLTGCTTTRHAADSTFKPPRGSYKLMVMQPEISVGVLTAGGAFEFREDWTKQATQNVVRALSKQQYGRGGQTKVARTREETGADPALVADLVWLHTAVGQAVRMHKFGFVPLPTKQNRFDWTLGETAVTFGTTTQFDYALFLHATDSFSSGGRVALQIVGALAGVSATGGTQTAFASLVDLKTGQVVWFNTLFSSVGDIRTPEGAEEMVAELLQSMQPDKTSKGP
jgi:hypothetical protein